VGGHFADLAALMVMSKSTQAAKGDTVSFSQSETVDSLAAVLKVLADPTRIRLIATLESSGRRTASSLSADVPGSQQGISHHLGVLHQAGVVSRSRDGLWVWYELCDWTGAWILRQLAAGLAEAGLERA